MAEPDPAVTEGRRPFARGTAQARLDALIRENRFTIAVVFPVVGAVLLTASARGLLPGWLAFNPLAILLGTLVMRLPLLGALGPLLDRRSGAALFGLALYAQAIELVGVPTG
jgi:putative membrane protein